jgi:spore coat protein U-like protein
MTKKNANWLRISALAFMLVICNARPSYALCLACSCGVSATGVLYPTYAPQATSPTTGTGVVSVNCSIISGLVSLVVSYSINLSTGSSGTFSARTMTQGSSALSYNLYTNSTHATVWGDTTGGTSDVTDSYLLALGPATTKNYTVYGQIPISQNVIAGSYTDSIVVTITY